MAGESSKQSVQDITGCKKLSKFIYTGASAVFRHPQNFFGTVFTILNNIFFNALEGWYFS
jgi:hypothetical protein